MKSYSMTNLPYVVVFFFVISAKLSYSQSDITAQALVNRQPNFSLALMLSQNTSEIISTGFNNQLQDSTSPAKPMTKLIPDRLSIVERMFWGESGILRSTGIAPLTPSARRNELTYRRNVLSVHEVGGFTTLALFIPTLIYGQKNINMRNAAAEGRGTFDQNLAHTHKILGEVTFGVYMTTAALALFSPPPMIRRNEWSTISTHKTLAIIHFTGMVALPILGYLAFHAKDRESEKSLQQAHQITAYVTAAALTASMVIVTF